jgi:hypothetical protein
MQCTSFLMSTTIFFANGISILVWLQSLQQLTYLPSAAMERIARLPQDRVLREQLPQTTQPRHIAPILYHPFWYCCPLLFRTKSRWPSPRNSKQIFIIRYTMLKYTQGLLREMVDTSTQTKDADTTLTEIEQPVLEEVVIIKKRKRCV